MTTKETDVQIGGELHIEDSVLDKIAEVAAGEVDGVHSVGRTGIGGAIDTVRGSSVSSDHGNREAAFSLDLVVVWGQNIPNIVSAVRTAVANAIRQMTDLETVAIDINIRDIFQGQLQAGRRLE